MIHEIINLASLFLLLAFIISCERKELLPKEDDLLLVDNEMTPVSFEVALVKPVKSKGRIHGVDYTMTPCSGGWWITIDEDEIIYRFENIVLDTDIDMWDGDFPKDIQLVWSPADYCYARIFIESMELL